MLGLFAVTDPQTTLASGNILAILALIIVVLAGVVVYLARKLDKQATDSATDSKRLNQIIYDDAKAHAADYKDMAEKNAEVLQLNSQSNTLLATKIESVRDQK